MKRNKKRGKTNYKNKGVFISILRVIILMFIGLTYFIYYIFKNIHTIVGKVFMCLPRLTKVAIIYTLIFCAGFGVYVGQQQDETVNYNINPSHQLENIKLKLEVKDVVQAETMEPEKTTVEKVCAKYSNVECLIFKKAKNHGLSDNYGFMIMAISKHETGNWTSSIYNNYYNMGGIIGSNGFRKYNSLDEGIEDFVNLLDRYYINNGRTTIESIGAKYCPVGASNDPTGLNQHWVPQVTRYYNQYVS